jgi:hypothetical protein
MPGENENRAAEAVHAAAEAVEEIEKGKPTSKLHSLTALLMAGAAFVTSVGASLKSCDHSVTENAYSTLTTGIQKVTDAEQQNHQDIVALRAYLDGLSRNPLSVVDAGAPMPAPTTAASFAPPPPMSGSSGGSSGSGSSSGSSARPPRPMPTSASMADAGVISFVIPPPPPVSPAPAPWKAPAWPDVAAGR